MGLERHGAEQIGAHVGCDDARALACEALRAGAADALCGSRDEGRLAGEPAGRRLRKTCVGGVHECSMKNGMIVILDAARMA